MQHILEILMAHINQIRLYHWKTMSYARHKATDEYMETLNPIIDNIIESLQGGREMRIVDSFKTDYISLTDNTAMAYLKSHRDWLEHRMPILLNKEETDILNLRDEMLAALKRLMYLFTLK
jgi:hypothetical protein